MTMARASMMLGGSVAIHAIGDRANDRVLDVFEELVDMGADPERLRVEHASLLTDAAIERMARLGVTASVQPAFLASEGDWLEKRLGEERMNRVYPFRSLLEAGVKVIGGSDSPVELPDPAIGISRRHRPPRLQPVGDPDPRPGRGPLRPTHPLLSGLPRTSGTTARIRAEEPQVRSIAARAE